MSISNMQTVLCTAALPKEIFALFCCHDHHHPFIVIAFGLSHKYYVTAARHTYVSVDMSLMTVKPSISTTSHTCTVHALCVSDRDLATDTMAMFVLLRYSQQGSPLAAAYYDRMLCQLRLNHSRTTWRILNILLLSCAFWYKWTGRGSLRHGHHIHSTQHWIIGHEYWRQKMFVRRLFGK